MYGVFKKLKANDIKITPFEAHKQYIITDVGSSGMVTSSAYWSSNNRSTFTSESIKYYQIDKLYYRDYIHSRAHRLELNDAPYKKQERRLYETASIISIPQHTFGNEVQPGTLVISSSYTLYDDGFGNLYDNNLGKDNFPDEDNRVLYLGLSKGFKLKNLSIDPKTGNQKVNYTSSFYGKTYDDSYLSNIVEFYDINFNKNSFNDFYQFEINDDSNSLIQIENRPYLNFNDSNFTICFNLDVYSVIQTLLNTGGTGLINTPQYLISKEGAYLAPSTPSEIVLGNTQLIQSNNNFPYRIYIEYRNPTDYSGSIFFERSDGSNITVISSSFTNGSTTLGENVHITCQKTGSELKIYINGELTGNIIDNTNYCGNNCPITLLGKVNNDGTISNRPQVYGTIVNTPISQLMMWDTALTSEEIIKVSESITGTYPVGNIFYDNGFAVITHPEYQDTLENLHSISYRNTYPITEYEYQCTVGEQEFNFTSNLTARKTPSIFNDEFANFATGSNFRPYVTTVGLYDDNGDLLAIGKLGQPVKISEETDTTFVLRFDL